MTTLVAVIILAASIALVGWPLMRGSSGLRPRLVEDPEVSELLAQKDSTLLAISELEADHEMGNLSKSDYQELRTKYEEKAVSLMKTADQLQSERGLGAATAIDDEIEARVAGLRRSKKSQKPQTTGKLCPACGAAVSPDASFCSRCGAALSLTCPGCAVPVGVDDLFCSRCGVPIAGGPGQ